MAVRNRHAQGFGLIGLILFIAILAAAAFAGWRIYNERYGSNKAYQCGLNTETLKGGCIPAAGDK